MQQTLDVSNAVAAELAGISDGVLDALKERLQCTVRLRGNQLTLEGDDSHVENARAVIDELVELVEGGHQIGSHTVDAVLGTLEAGQDVRDVFDAVVWRHRGKKIAPKTVTQKQYVDSIRRSTVTFGIGPAGTGKTYLAMALAVAALHEREVARIILTRPAVEAGERLGFLPGDMMAKVDPYLRPLFDALYDMLDPDKALNLIDRGTIEVAPLAFMRGRAQPLSSGVLTPEGFRPIGSLRVGDLVIGSDGIPTPVLGVYPQGMKEVFRVSTQDGASTLCCAEHLWHVYTPESHGGTTGAHVLQTREMVGQLRQGRIHRYELPLLSRPACFEPREELPIEPYALGRMLGDEDGHFGAPVGSLGTSRTLFKVSETSSATATRTHELPATRSFVPDAYLHSSAAARAAVLQGLLDSDSGAVGERDGTCCVHFTTAFEGLRDDVAYIVRSLGGVAYWQRRHRAFVMEIRLPSSIEPFRLRRKREIYRRDGGRRPRRFVDAIEPEGKAETVCIQVAAADSLYVTEDFLVTHNTLNDSFIILDEAQNTSPEQMQMFLTRLGFGSKVVVTGDITQIDLPREQRSGLVHVRDVLRNIDGINFVEFGHRDVVRHKLVQRIVEAYKEHTDERNR